MIEYWKKDKFLAGFSNHFLNDVNSTLPYYPPLMYVFIRAHQHKEILEVGIEAGYSTYYLAYAAEMNGGMYYGVDVNEESCNHARKQLAKAGLPHKIIQADTKKLKRIDFMEKIDFAFLDGEHTTEAVEHEVELIYPLLADRGWGYIFIHDIVDMGNAGIWLKLTKDKRFEAIGLNPNYGLGILRKLEGVNYEDIAKKFEQSIHFKRRWDLFRDLINGNNYKIIAEIGDNDGKMVRALLGNCDIRKYIMINERFRNEVKSQLDERRVAVWEKPSLEVAKMFEDGTFDLIFLNPHQTTTEDDIKVWLPKIKKGGIIGGSDYFKSRIPNLQVYSAVNEILGKVNLIPEEMPKGDKCIWWKTIE